LLIQQMPNALIQRALYWFRSSYHSRLHSWSLIALLFCGLQMQTLADPVPVRYVQGTVHGFLVERGEDGHIVASGDSVQVVHGDLVTNRTIFTYKDGSVDDETTVFSQRRSFRLISDHHIQKGPFFPHPMDLTIDARSGQVTVKTTGKAGKEEVYAEHMNLPPDLANGMVSQLMGNLKAAAQTMTVSIVVTTPKPRIVKLVISSIDEESFSVAGATRKSLHCEAKIIIGGVAGLVAPLIGKAPPNIEIWEIGGEAPTFLKETGPTFEDGPIVTIELAGPEWPVAKGNA
jgi:hypothetical protein